MLFNTQKIFMKNITYFLFCSSFELKYLGRHFMNSKLWISNLKYFKIDVYYLNFFLSLWLNYWFYYLLLLLYWLSMFFRLKWYLQLFLITFHNCKISLDFQSFKTFFYHNKINFSKPHPNFEISLILKTWMKLLVAKKLQEGCQNKKLENK